MVESAQLLRHLRISTIVFIVGDNGERYTSGPLVNELVGGIN
jgi:hypothetical protein